MTTSTITVPAMLYFTSFRKLPYISLCDVVSMCPCAVISFNPPLDWALLRSNINEANCPDNLRK